MIAKFLRRQVLAGAVAAPVVALANQPKAEAATVKSLEVLSAPRTYYVTTTGSDDNDGLTPEKPLASLQGAWDRAKLIYAAGFDVTIRVADGTYPRAIVGFGPILGAERLHIIGNEDNPSACFLDCHNENCFVLLDSAKVAISGFKMRTTTAGQMLMVRRGSQVFLGNMEFSDSATDHMFCDKASIEHLKPYTISGSTRGAHHHCILDADIGATVRVKILGNVHFGTHYCANAKGFIDYTGATFDGSATGSQYYVHFMGVMRLSGVTLPGNIAGTFTGGCVDDNIQDTNGVILRAH